jgi:flagellar motor switch protein FliM
MVENFIHLLNEAWMQVFDIGAELESFESDPQFVQITRSTEALAIIFFDIRIRGITYMLNIGLPYYVLEPILAKLSAQAVLAQTNRKHDVSHSELIRDRLRASYLPMRVVLADTSIQVRDFIEMQKDDLIQVDKKTNAPLLIFAGGKPKFIGSPGKLGRKRAIKILRPITREEELIYE